MSYELHRYIIGQKGSGIRKMMEEYEVRIDSLVPSSGQNEGFCVGLRLANKNVVSGVQVNIWVPQPEKQLDGIKVTGLTANVERAKQGLLDRVKELQAEQADRVNKKAFPGSQHNSHHHGIVRMFEVFPFRPCAASR